MEKLAALLFGLWLITRERGDERPYEGPEYRERMPWDDAEVVRGEYEGWGVS